MKTIAFFLTLFPFYGFSQIGAFEYDADPSDEAVIIQDSVFIPVKKKNKTVYQVHPIGQKEHTRIFDPKTELPITLEGDYMYIHMSEKLKKCDRKTMKEIWSSNYGSSGWSPQWEPMILSDQYIACIVDDHIAIFNKEDGKLILDLEGKDFEDGISLSKDYLICTKWGGKTWAVDLRNGKTVWSVNVGEQAGYGNVTDNGKIYIPSWDPKFFCLDQKTGKKIWTLNLKSYKNGCGSGFEETPVLVGDKLYAVHRDNGLFIIDKNTGEILENKDDFTDIVDNIELYKGKYALFMDTDYFYIYSTENNQIHSKIALPKKMRTGFFLNDDHIVATQDKEWKNFPYKKAVITIDLKQYIK